MPDINFWAVLAASIAGFPLGALWYSHRVFGRISYHWADPGCLALMGTPITEGS